MLEDIELIRRFRNGDETGFDELVRRYQQRVQAVVYRLVHNREDASDLAQDVFVRAYRALPGFQEKSSFYTWLYRIAVNCAFSFLRSQRTARARVQPDGEEALENAPAPDSPESDYRQTQMRTDISAAVAKLPDGQRAVFVMRRYDGMSNQEIAQVLHRSEGTVKAQYFFAVKKLQQALKEWM
jgi:RNA polymerase sigma-70 factor, ECF subfamily